MSTNEFFLGIDGGGSKCRALLVNDHNEVLGRGVAGPANVFQDLNQAIESIQTATQLAIEDAALHSNVTKQLVAGLALAGLHSPKLFDVMSRWQHPYKKMYLTNDLHAACLGAHQGDDGGVVIVGTGSCGVVSMHGNTKTYGAHGFPFGDQGSGAWIGLEAIKAVLLASDQLGPKTQISELLLDKYKCQSVNIVDHFIRAPSRDYAKIAPIVVEAANNHDAVANQILREGATYIEKLLCLIMDNSPPRVSFMGGLAAVFIPMLKPEVKSLLSSPKGVAEDGAIYFAKQQWLRDACVA